MYINIWFTNSFIPPSDFEGDSSTHMFKFQVVLKGLSKQYAHDHLIKVSPASQRQM